MNDSHGIIYDSLLIVYSYSNKKFNHFILTKILYEQQKNVVEGIQGCRQVFFILLCLFTVFGLYTANVFPWFALCITELWTV